MAPRQVGSFRLKPHVMAALKAAADHEERSVSATLERILVEWLRSKGFLPAPESAVDAPKQGADS
jgi:hypothetical protein